MRPPASDRPSAATPTPAPPPAGGPAGSPVGPEQAPPASSTRRRPEDILSELEVFGIRLGLESTRALLAALGNPERRYRVVLVAGTNGKGSTSSLLASILRAAGCRVGLYTSPHLEEVGERVRVGGVAIESEVMAELLERVVEQGRRTLGHPPTYFEALTVAAYAHFAAAGIEVAVVEVGLGGRLDATNAADPVLSIVTSISRDHVKVLGDTLDRIAREKAGILRCGRTALHGLEPAEARAALEDEARRVCARLLDAHALTRVEEETAEPRRVLLRTPAGSHRLELDVEGAYQLRNLAMAVLAAETLAEEQGIPLPAEAIERGVRAWRWPGRCERVALPGGREVLLDAAHNEEGIAWLRREVERTWAGGGRPRQEPAAAPSATTGEGFTPWRLVFGALDDKPADEMLATISPGAELVVLVRPPSPRGVDPRDLAGALPPERVEIADSPAAALDLALEDGGRRVVVCGSIYLVGEIRAELRRRFGVPEPASAPWTAD